MLSLGVVQDRSNSTLCIWTVSIISSIQQTKDKFLVISQNLLKQQEEQSKLQNPMIVRYFPLQFSVTI